MTSRAVVCAIAALSMGLSGLAVAQQDKDVRADRANREEHRVPQRADNRDHGRPAPQRADNNRDYGRPAPPQRMDRGRGAGPDHNYYRGGRLPREYRSNVYVVDDWRGHHLRQPPRGYHWVQTGPDYVLVAITTGIIASILLSQ
jgi:Ni/Co efflux regulator RcnB